MSIHIKYSSSLQLLMKSNPFMLELFVQEFPLLAYIFNYLFKYNDNNNNMYQNPEASIFIQKSPHKVQKHKSV